MLFLNALFVSRDGARRQSFGAWSRCAWTRALAPDPVRETERTEVREEGARMAALRRRGWTTVRAVNGGGR